MIINAGQIRTGSQLAEADGFLWDVVEIVKETPKTITVRLCSDFSSFENKTGRNARRRYKVLSQILEIIWYPLTSAARLGGIFRLTLYCIII